MYLFFSCTACPSQWEGWSTLWEPVYIRYRHGILTAQIGPKRALSWWQFGLYEIYRYDNGTGMGVMTTPQMKLQLAHVFDFPKQVKRGSLPGKDECPDHEWLQRVNKKMAVI